MAVLNMIGFHLTATLCPRDNSGFKMDVTDKGVSS